MTDVHSDSACMPLVMGNSVSLRDLILWLTTLFTRRFSSLLNWNLSYWDSSLDLVLTRWQHRTSLLFFWQKEYPRYFFNFLDIVILLSLTLLPLIFHPMDKQLLFPYPFTMGSDLQTPYHPGHIQLAAIIDWMICCAVLSCSLVSYSLQPWTVACQAPLSMGILHARILEWVAMPSSRGSSQPGNWIGISFISGRFFTNWATRETLISLIKSH